MSTKAPPRGCDCGDHHTHACVAGGEFTHVATCAQGHRWYRTDEALPRHKCAVAGCGHRFVAVDPLAVAAVAIKPDEPTMMDAFVYEPLPTSPGEAYAQAHPGVNPETPACKDGQHRKTDTSTTLSDSTVRCGDCGHILSRWAP